MILAIGLVCDGVGRVIGSAIGVCVRVSAILVDVGAVIGAIDNVDE